MEGFGGNGGFVKLVGGIPGNFRGFWSHSPSLTSILTILVSTAEHPIESVMAVVKVA